MFLTGIDAVIGILLVLYIPFGVLYVFYLTFEIDSLILDDLKLRIWQILLAIFFLPFTLIGIAIFLFAYLLCIVETTSFGQFFKKEITLHKKKK